MYSLGHPGIVNLLNCAQARARESAVSGDLDRANGEGLTVATYSRRLSDLWSDFSRRELPY